MGTSNSKRHGFLWWIVFISGLIYASLLTFSLLVDNWFAWAFGLPEVLHVVVPVVVLALIFGSVAVAWKWKLISGIVLTVVGLFLIIWSTIAEPLAEPTFFLPLPVLGVLFILSWFLRGGRGAQPPAPLFITGHKPLWWAAFILGLIGAAFWTIGMVSGGYYATWWFVTALAIMPWVGLALTWKRSGVGGVVLITTLSLLFLGYTLGLLSEKPNAWELMPILYGFPFIVASGVLFLLAWWKGRRPSKETGS